MLFVILFRSYDKSNKTLCKYQILYSMNKNCTMQMAESLQPRTDMLELR